MFRKERCGGENVAAFDGTNMDMNKDYMASMPATCCCPPDPCMNRVCPPVYECPQEQVCHRTINYEVPHMIPCHTRMINHHVYHHSYMPCYSYSEEDEYTNVYGNRCC